MGKVFKMLRLNYVATAAESTSFFRQTRILRMFKKLTVVSIVCSLTQSKAAGYFLSQVSVFFKL